MEFSVAVIGDDDEPRIDRRDDEQAPVIRCKVWDKSMGRNVLDSLRSGTEVIAIVEICRSEWVDKKTGESRSSIDFVVTDIAPGLRQAVVTWLIRNEDRSRGIQAYRAFRDSHRGAGPAAAPKKRGRLFDGLRGESLSNPWSGWDPWGESDPDDSSGSSDESSGSSKHEPEL